MAEFTQPLVGPVDMTWVGKSEHYDYTRLNALTGTAMAVAEGTDIAWDSIEPCGTAPLSWVIVGGESGPKARPCNVSWIRAVVKQCADAAVPCFVKQLGSRPVDTDGVDECVSTWPLQLRDRKGGDPAEWPADLRVRQWPGVRGG